MAARPLAEMPTSRTNVSAISCVELWCMDVWPTYSRLPGRTRRTNCPAPLLLASGPDCGTASLRRFWVSLISPSIRIYETNNKGRPYDFGSSWAWVRGLHTLKRGTLSKTLRSEVPRCVVQVAGFCRAAALILVIGSLFLGPSVSAAARGPARHQIGRAHV